MIETVQTLATKYGREKGIENNDVGTVSTEEAKEAIRTNRGNVWAAVTECVDNRRKKVVHIPIGDLQRSNQRLIHISHFIKIAKSFCTVHSFMNCSPVEYSLEKTF